MDTQQIAVNKHTQKPFEFSMCTVEVVCTQGSKKVPSHYPGQVDFPSRQVTLHSHMPNGQETKQVMRQLNH